VARASGLTGCAGGLTACAGGLLLLDGVAKPIEPSLPKAAVARHPGIKLAERLGTQRIKAPLSIGPHLNEPRLKQNAQVPRDAGLMDVEPAHYIVHLLLAAAKHFDDAAAGRVGDGLEGV
jgi:hypothetical protein